MLDSVLRLRMKLISSEQNLLCSVVVKTNTAAVNNNSINPLDTSFHRILNRDWLLEREREKAESKASVGATGGTYPPPQLPKVGKNCQ